jgi:hypothetical protein
MVKVKVYCKRCGSLINEIDLNNELPKTLKDHIICRECYNNCKFHDSGKCRISELTVGCNRSQECEYKEEGDHDEV